MKTLSLWTFGLLLFTFGGAHGVFPENFVVVKRNDPRPVTLTCNTQTDRVDSWTLDGEEVELDSQVQMEGPNLKVSEVDASMLGKYSCWSGGKMLSSTYLFQELEEEGDLDSLLSCRAKSYDCNFTCSLKDSRFTAVRLGLGQDCSEGQQSCQWESSGSSSHEGELQFVLPHSLSPYAEESTMLELTAEATNMYYILRRTKTFYLRDIIQPDSPQIVRCEEVGEQLNVSVDPPPSWSTPHSFFSLEYEIQYELKDDGKIENSSSTLIPKKISRLRVRSRDSLVLSAWSQWTAWQNVNH